MRRVQVQLTEGQVAKIQQLALETGQPVAAVVRDAVNAWIAASERDSQVQRALAAVGVFRSGLGDLAEEHDRYLE